MEILIIAMVVGVPFAAGCWCGVKWERGVWHRKVENGDLMTPFGAVMYCKSHKKKL